MHRMGIFPISLWWRQKISKNILHSRGVVPLMSSLGSAVSGLNYYRPLLPHKAMTDLGKGTLIYLLYKFFYLTFEANELYKALGGVVCSYC